MYVAVYHWTLKPDRVTEFERLWTEGTRLIRLQYGSLGSRLHRADDQTYFAYAQWPSRESYHRRAPASPELSETLRAMGECVDVTHPTLLGDALVDLLA